MSRFNSLTPVAAALALSMVGAAQAEVATSKAGVTVNAAKGMKEGKCGEGKCGKKLEGAAVQGSAKAAITLDNANLKAATSLNKANAEVQQGASQMEAVKGAAGIQR